MIQFLIIFNEILTLSSLKCLKKIINIDFTNAFIQLKLIMREFVNCRLKRNLMLNYNLKYFIKFIIACKVSSSRTLL